MARSSLLGLKSLVEEIGLGPIPSFEAANILNNFIDIYRSYLAENFQTLIECNSNLIYESIQLSNATANGDLDIVLPKLRLPGTNPKELVGELMRKVC
jgi:arginyl-tRNA synthetase